MKVFSLIGECAEKSELVRRLVVELTSRGLRVSTIKRVSDAVDLERPGSGTWKHRKAGAEEVMIANGRRFALLREMPSNTVEPDVGALLARMAPVDIVLLDGFRRTSSMPKMEVVPIEKGQPQYAAQYPKVLALASDRPISGGTPCLPLSEIDILADFVLANAVMAG
jgi:molybdopterin-guanine dinucleotide biosynthesis adapter protein